MDSHKVPISILVPTRNEIRNLPKCLSAIKDWADEIVVVDSGSTDGTIEYAQENGATVLQFSYLGGWPKKRQWALDTYQFRNDWILLLDADEILLEPVKQEISGVVSQSKYNGYWVRFEIFFLGRQLRYGNGSLWKLSLFRRGKGRYEVRLDNQDMSMADIEIHEHVIVDGHIGRLRNPVRHENINSLDRYIQKHNEYSNWSARVFLNGKQTEVGASLWGNQAQRRRWLKLNFLWCPGSPLAFFLLVYFFKLGFLDGKPGFLYAVFSAIQMFHTKAKIYEYSRLHFPARP